jgi:hypothetical protein
MNDHQRNKLDELMEAAAHAITTARQHRREANQARQLANISEEQSGHKHSEVSEYLQQLVRMSVLTQEEAKSWMAQLDRVVNGEREAAIQEACPNLFSPPWERIGDG